MHLRKVGTAVVVAAALVYSGFLIQQSIRSGHNAASNPAALSHATIGTLPGDVAPNFTLATVSGKTIALSSLRGRGVWLNFWATWCPHCKQELAILEQEQKLNGTQVAIIGVDMQQSKSLVQPFAAARGLTYPIALDTTGSVSAEFGINALPTSVFIKPDGTIDAVYEGAMENMAMATRYLNQISRRS